MIRLQQAVEVLGNLNVQVALDMGVHTHCDLQSNCPLAVQLRKLMSEAGVTGEQLLAGLASLPSLPEEIHLEIPKVNAIADVNVGGVSVKVDLAPGIKTQLSLFYRDYIKRVQESSRQLEVTGKSLHTSYISAILESRKLKELPQLKFSVGELIHANCMITSDGTNYVFLFPRTYNPLYIVTNGVRYQLAESDMIGLIRNICVQVIIQRDKFMDVRILDKNGDKFYHYHGRGQDCWGQVERPPRWDKRLRSLENMVIQLMGALATINKDSIMERVPAGMPNIDALFERATRLGVEGHIKGRIGSRASSEESIVAPRPGWGRWR